MTTQNTQPKAGHTPIPGFDGYGFNAAGCVVSLRFNWRGYGVRELDVTPNADNYPSVRLMFEGRRKRIAIHRLVALAFLPPRPSPRHEIRHLDGNRWNWHPTNLAWGTRKDNAADREKHGRTSRGQRHSAAIKKGLAKATA